MLPWYSSMATGGNARIRSVWRHPSQIAVPTSSAIQIHQNVGQDNSAAGAKRRAATGVYGNAPSSPATSR